MAARQHRVHELVAPLLVERGGGHGGRHDRRFGLRRLLRSLGEKRRELVLLLVLLGHRSLLSGSLVRLSLGAFGLFRELGVLALLLALRLLGGELSVPLSLGRLGLLESLGPGFLLRRQLGFLLGLLRRQLGLLLGLLPREHLSLGRLLRLYPGRLLRLFHGGSLPGDSLFLLARSLLPFLGRPRRLLLRRGLRAELLVGRRLLRARPRPSRPLQQTAGFRRRLVLVRIR